ncbi:WxL domain-containing protein [Enterococcus sp. LJL120]
MKRVSKRLTVLTLLLLSSAMVGGVSAQATSASHDLGNSGSVTVVGTETSDLIDPENPTEIVDPGDGYSTTGPLRIDFISDLGFGLERIGTTDRIYNSLAQLFHSDTEPRGYYVQISDYREDVSGWQLQVSQEGQFSNNVIQNTQEQELLGATLSFTNGWANTNGSEDPANIVITNEAIAISEMNANYTVAVAGEGSGKGVWTIAFGGSANAGYQNNNSTGTLAPLVTADDEAVMDTTFNKQAYSNSAIQLSVPNNTVIYPVQYTTTLRWTLLAGPA